MKSAENSRYAGKYKVFPVPLKLFSKYLTT